MATTQDAAALTPGSRLDGYVIERLIGQTRHGYRYLAQDAAEREVLIREFLPLEFAERAGGTVRPRDAEDRNSLRFWLRAFLEKSTQISRLVHPALPQVQRQFEAQGTAYEVCDYAPGETLQALLESDGVIAEAHLLRILTGVMGALETAHGAGLLHRDLCPAHIWLRDSDGTPCVQEFGVLRSAMRLKSRTVPSHALPPFAAPEDDASGGTLTSAADIYALGVIAWRALTGVLPPSALERRQGAVLKPLADAARVRCSAGLISAVEWALQMQPEQRPRSMAEWRTALLSNAAGDQASPVSSSPAAASRSSGSRAPTASRKPMRFVVPVLVVVSMAALGYLLKPGGSSAPPPASPAASTPTPVAATAGEAAAPAAAAPQTPANAGGDGQSSLDQLALDLIARERKLQEAREAQNSAEERDKLAAKAKEAPANKPAGAAAAPAPPAAPSPATVEAEARTRALEQEVTRLRAESESRQRAEDDAAKVSAQAAADKEAAARSAEADRTRQTQAIALARKKCPLPAMDLSEGGNLNYYNALQAPGARRMPDGAIRLPPVEVSDGKPAVYEITADSCAHRVR